MQRSSNIQQSSEDITRIETCKICRNLDVDEFEGDDYPSSGVLRLERRLNEIKKSSQSDCGFCKVFAESIEYLSGDPADPKKVSIHFCDGNFNHLFLLGSDYAKIEVYSPRG